MRSIKTGPPPSSVETIRCEAYKDDPLRVARVAMKLPDKEQIEVAAERLSALGHPVRATILAAIAIEPLCVCELSALLGMSSPALIHHLRILSGAGVIEAHKEGKFAVYRPTDEMSLLALQFASQKRVPLEVAKT